MIAYGPVPSRRLGRSLGINNIPPKYCSYSCVYCQLGRTNKLQADYRTFYQPEDILKAVAEKIEKTREVKESIDYLTFVSDGEPTLDINLGREIELLHRFGMKIAVITNASLLWHANVRENLMKADWVSLKVDSLQNEIWRRINRPHRTIHLPAIMEGILEFAKTYQGTLVTETMLVEDINDDTDHLRTIVNFLAEFNPAMAYLSIPIRPPAEKWVNPPSEEGINRAYQIFNEKLDKVEYLIGYEGNTFAFTGNVEEDLLSITAVHPMTEAAVQEYLMRAQADWSVILNMITLEKLIEIEYHQEKYYMRNLHG